MRAIYCILLSFVFMYTGVHFKAGTRFYRKIKGVFVSMSFMCIIGSFILMLLGL